jgi:hypothetical protein
MEGLGAEAGGLARELESARAAAEAAEAAAAAAAQTAEARGREVAGVRRELLELKKEGAALAGRLEALGAGPMFYNLAFFIGGCGPAGGAGCGPNVL